MNVATHAHAQAPPDAGTMRREMELDRALSQPRTTLPETSPAPMKEADKESSAVVSAFRITGATLIPESELAALLADRTGQRLIMTDLERAAQRIAAHYRARGWFARVYLPAQEVRDGVVNIAIVEGRLGGVEVEAAEHHRTNTDFIRRMVARKLSIGKALRVNDLERGLLLANDLPGVSATGVLEPGKVVGETRLRLKVLDKPLLAGSVALTNYGIKSTGTMQYSAGLLLNSPAGRGDQVGLRALISERSEMARLHVALPLNSDGLRLSGFASYMHYRLGREFASLHASGEARTFGVGVNYPWLRAQTFNINFGAGLENRYNADDSLGSSVRRHRINAFTMRMDADRSDGYGGGGATQVGIALTTGRLDLGGNAADLEADQASARTDGGYAKLAGSISRLQRLPRAFSLYTAISGQYASKNLDSSEKFALGGPFGVRAYPVNEAVGDEGWLFTLELHRELRPGWRIFGLLDSGRIRLHHNTWSGWQGGASTPNRYTLTGGGMGIIWEKAGRFSLSLTVAAPMDDNPGQTSAGRNNDGSSTHAARAWLNAAMYF